MGGKWSICRVKDIEGKTFSGPFGSNIKSSDYVHSGIPVIRGFNLSGPRFNEKDYVFLIEEKAKALSSSIALPNDVVFVARGTVGLVGLVPTTYKRYILSPNLVGLRINTNLADPRYVFYYFRSYYGQSEIRSYVSTTGVPKIARALESLRNFRVFLPPLPEQRAIAHILGTLDDKIELNRRMNETLEAMAQALFRSWFVDFDPVIVNAIKAGNPIPEKFAKRAAHYRDNPDALGLPEDILNLFPDRFVDSELGPIPEGWEVKALGEFMDVNPSRPLAKGTIAPYIDMANMPTRGHIPLAIRERAFTSGAKFINGDTLLARITPCLENGKTAFVDFLEEHQVGWGSTEFIVLRPKQPFPPIFGYMISRDPTFREYAIQSMTGSSGRQRVQISAIKNYLLPCPTEKIARAFGHQAQPLFKTVKVKSDESRTLAALRDTLLPKLISGELRVPDVEKILEEVE